MASEVPAFRRATVADAPAILEVIEAAFDEWPSFEIPVSRLKHLEWKMQPPVEIEPGHTLGEIDGRVMCVELRWLSDCYVGGEVWLGNVGADKSIRPEYQGRGFNRALNTADVRLPQPGRIGIETPSRNARILATRGDDGRAKREVRVWARPLGLGATLRLSRVAGPRKVVVLLGARLGVGAPSREALAGTRIEVIEQFDERADALWERATTAFDVATVRNARYLNWRHADPRAGRTLILGAFEGDSGSGGELLGYAVFRRSGGHANLVDVLVDPDRRGVLAPVLAEGVARMGAAGCGIVTAWLPPGHPDAAGLEAAGFLDVGASLPLELDTPPGQEADEVQLARFEDTSLRVHVTLGDFDFA